MERTGDATLNVEDTTNLHRGGESLAHLAHLALPRLLADRFSAASSCGGGRASRRISSRVACARGPRRSSLVSATSETNGRQGRDDCRSGQAANDDAVAQTNS